MLQDGSCVISPAISRCASKCNWDQSFIDEDQPINANTRVASQLVQSGMNTNTTKHCYQNVGISSNHFERTVSLDSEWDSTKISKDILLGKAQQCQEKNPNSSEHCTASVNEQGSSLLEGTSSARNSLSTVVRRACSRSLRGSVTSPPNSPLCLGSSRSIIIDSRTLNALTSLAVGIEGKVSNLPRVCDDSSCDRTSGRVAYENLYSRRFSDNQSTIRRSSNSSYPCISITSSDTDSVISAAISDRSGASGDSHPDGELLACCEDSGLSSSGSESVSCRLSPISVCFEYPTADSLSEVGSAGFYDDRRTNHKCSIASRRDRCSRVCDRQLENTNTSQTLRNRLGSYAEDDDCRIADLSNLEISRRRLLSCTFYLGKKSADEASALLVNTSTGTFLLRDSSDERFVYSISVQTTRGPTSIRVGYLSDRFYLDSEPHQMPSIPKFECILELIQFYVQHSRSSYKKTKKSVIMEVSNQRNCTVMLLRPYESRPSSLSHMCRRTIHRQLEGRDANRLCLIPSLKKYLKEYPCDL